MHSAKLTAGMTAHIAVAAQGEQHLGAKGAQHWQDYIAGDITHVKQGHFAIAASAPECRFAPADMLLASLANRHAFAPLQC